MAKDTLFILERSYTDDDGEYFCRDCVEVDGLLALFPELGARLNVIRVPWTKPRVPVVEALGEDNQNCPALAFPEGGFVNTQDALLAALHERHGFPIRSS
ncbi:DUF3088 family protein [Aurantiacibacter gangjinensis]|uniref:Uncharacterized protein n=1 Tax=Aurantiacibacter gangjinensis TaxID=502682 RepID=A0A0G9MN86_9SPHN|nr:DUF3088 family protein [Aurantiacibacter gangjinensis]APE27253.1 hypothetical protein BMF35_a0424 [Aurantiacibacter gangjinensis]KLE32157.1 hypothetical protein AAW01_07135 [Aurantiacibacter gangjinensis]